MKRPIKLYQIYQFLKELKDLLREFLYFLQANSVKSTWATLYWTLIFYYGHFQKQYFIWLYYLFSSTTIIL